MANKRALIGLAAVGLILAATAGPAQAQVRIDKNRPAIPEGAVSIENHFGSVKVTGWDRNEISVQGVLAAGAEGLDLSNDKDSAWIEVDIPESWLYESDDDSEYQTHLEISVPMGSSVEVESLNATVTIESINGEIEVESINGAVVIDGDPASVDVETMTGSINVNARAAEMEIETISGTVTLNGGARGVDVETVSGPINITAGEIREVEIETTSGDVTFTGSFSRGDGSFEVETFSGHVDLTLPHDTAAKFHLVTFNGAIENEIGPRPRRDGRFNPFQEVRFSTGLLDYEVSVSTYSGNIELRVAGGAGGAR